MLLRRFLRIRVLQAAYAFEVSGNDGEHPGLPGPVSVHEQQLSESIRDMDILPAYILYVIQKIFSVLPDFLSGEKMKFSRNEGFIRSVQDFIQSGYYQKVISLPGLPARHLSKHDSNKLSEPVQIIAREFTDHFFRNTQLNSQGELARKSTESNSLHAGGIKKMFLWILDHAMVRQWLDENNIFRHDNLPFILPVVIKALMDWIMGRTRIMAKVWKDPEENTRFCTRLFSFYTSESEHFENIIQHHTENWKINRLVLTDKILIKLALCEVFRFPEIPPKAILNEYIEISKYFSTPESGRFINGIIDKIIKARNKNPEDSGEIRIK